MPRIVKNAEKDLMWWTHLDLFTYINKCLNCFENRTCTQFSPFERVDREQRTPLDTILTFFPTFPTLMQRFKHVQRFFCTPNF